MAARTEGPARNHNANHSADSHLALMGRRRRRQRRRSITVLTEKRRTAGFLPIWS